MQSIKKDNKKNYIKHIIVRKYFIMKKCFYRNHVNAAKNETKNIKNILIKIRKIENLVNRIIKYDHENQIIYSLDKEEDESEKSESEISESEKSNDEQGDINSKSEIFYCEKSDNFNFSGNKIVAHEKFQEKNDEHVIAKEMAEEMKGIYLNSDNPLNKHSEIKKPDQEMHKKKGIGYGNDNNEGVKICRGMCGDNLKMYNNDTDKEVQDFDKINLKEKENNLISCCTQNENTKYCLNKCSDIFKRTFSEIYSSEEKKK